MHTSHDSPRFRGLLQRYPALSECSQSILDAFELLKTTYLQDHKILLCGNGGSAADSDHWAGELLKGFAHKRPLPPSMREGLNPHLADHLQCPLPAIPLTGFSALLTAFANDVEPAYIFGQLVLALGTAGDTLVALSTSGNSKNICHAAEVARARKISVLALTGSGGGKLKDLADICIRVPSSDTPHVQEFHLPIYHCLCLMLEDFFLERWK